MRKLAVVLALAIACFVPAYGAAADQPSIIALSTMNSVQVKVVDQASYKSSDVTYEIRHWPDGGVLTQGTVKAGDIKRDELGNPVFQISGLTPRVWSPKDPQLYTISVSNSSGNQIGKTRFGFRTFEIKDRKFYLNGQAIFLRSMPINPPGRELPDETSKDPEFIKGYLQLLKSAGCNMIRTLTNEWLDACDELGMLVFAGNYGPAYGGDGHTPPRDIEYSKQLYRPLFADLASHPGVVIYVLTNEVDYKNKKTGNLYKQFLGKICEDVKKLDPTRPVIGNAGFGHGEPGEVHDIHAYAGWYHGNYQDWYRMYAQYMADAKKMNQPLTFTECVGAYTSDAGVFLTMSKQMVTRTRWIGTSTDERSASLEYQAELVKQIVEIGRRQRTKEGSVAGIMPFTYFLGWSSAKKAEDLITTPAFEAFKTVFQPVLISPECWRRSIYPGDTLKFRLCIANDNDEGRDLSPSQALIEIIDSKGKEVASGKADYPSIPYYSNAWADVSIPISSDIPEGYYTVKCRLVENGKDISQNQFDFTVMLPTRPVIKNALVPVVYDPAGKTFKALDVFGVKYKKLSGLGKLPENGLLIIGEEAFGVNHLPAKASVLAFLERGGRILCLRQRLENWKSDWLPVNLVASTRRPLSHIAPVGENEAIYKSLNIRDMRFWNDLGFTAEGIPDVCPVLTPFKFDNVKDLSSCRVWASCDQLLSMHAVLEIFHGRGSIILSQFRCVERISEDPVAARLLANMVSYAASPDRPGLLDLTKPVKWNMEAFRTGAFVSMLQGFFPHSKTYKHDGSSKGLQGKDHSIDGFTMVGSYKYGSNGWLRPVPDPKVEGWGKMYGTLSRPVTRFVVKLHNSSGDSARIRLLVDGKEIGSPSLVMAGEERAIKWKINREAGPVEVELRGDQDLVITESSFE